MKKRPAQRHLSHILLLSLAILLVGGGAALLYQWNLGSTSSYASSDSVVGLPSMPASYVDAVFGQLGSPMAGTGKAVEAASRAQKIDDAFALAVWWTETNDGAAGVGSADLNPGSVRGSVGYPSAFDGYTIYPSFTAAINYWFKMMKTVYVNRGLSTVSSISHPYVGTSTSDLWAGKVITLMQKYRALAPKPTPTPSIAPNLKRQARQLSQEQRRMGQSKSTYYAPTPVVHPVASSSASSANKEQGMSSPARSLVVIFDLLLALALALLSWQMGKRSTVRQKIAQELPIALSPWEKMRAAGAQPAAFFQNFDGPQRTTDTLMPGLNSASAPRYSPRSPEIGLHAAETLAASWGAPGGQSGHNTTEDLVMVASPAPTFASAQQPAFSTPAFPVSPAPFHESQMPQQSFPAWGEPPFASHTSPMPPQSVLRRNRLQPAEQSAQPPSSINTTGGGLLSRYREKQEQV